MANVPNGGKKSDYGERLKRKRQASTFKFYITAVLLGGLIGLAYIKRVELVAAYNSVVNPAPLPAPVQPAAPIPAPVIVDVKPVEPRKPVQDAAPTPKPPANIAVEPSISPKDELKARQWLDAGKVSLEAFDFDGALKSFNAASKMKLGVALQDEAQVWARKAVEFQNATKHIAIADYALSENAVVIETTQGDELRGIKLREDADSVYLQQVNEGNPAAEGIQKFPIPVNEIRKIKTLPLAQRRVEFSDLVLGLESGTTISHSTDYYDLVYLSKRLGLGKECMMYLNRAFDGGPGHAPDPDLGESFRKVVVRRVIGRATLLMAGNHRIQVNDELKKLQKLLPDFPPANDEIAAFRVEVMDKVKADFKPSLVVNDRKSEPRKVQVAIKTEKSKPKAPTPDAPISIDVEKVQSAGAAGKVLDRGNAKFEEGMGVIRKYTVGVGGNKNDNNRILLLAKQQLLDAIDIYEEAIKLEPANKGIRDRQQTASQMVYFCNKNLIL